MGAPSFAEGSCSEGWKRLVCRTLLSPTGTPLTEIDTLYGLMGDRCPEFIAA